MPIGIPRIWLAANAVWMNPITRPRICGGKRSVAMAITTEPITPPNNPVTIRARSSDSKLCARPHHSVPRMKPA
jgi:hypothetical protein